MTLQIIPRVWRSSSVNVLEDLSFYQVLIEQRDQIARYRNESRKRARHAIFTCFAQVLIALVGPSFSCPGIVTAIVPGSRRRPARKRFNRIALTLMDSLANVFNEWLNRDGRKGNSMVNDAMPNVIYFENPAEFLGGCCFLF